MSVNLHFGDFQNDCEVPPARLILLIAIVIGIRRGIQIITFQRVVFNRSDRTFYTVRVFEPYW